LKTSSSSITFFLWRIDILSGKNLKSDAPPLIVVRHGIPGLFARMPADQAVKAEQVWQELQADLARMSSNSQLLVAEKSGHGIQTDQPELVVAAIRQMTETVRK